MNHFVFGYYSFFRQIRLPKMPTHIHISVGLERHALVLQQKTMLQPAWSRTPFFVHHAVARQLIRPGRISERMPHHSRMVRPSRPYGNMPVSRHPTARYLADNIQHIVPKPPRLRHRHLVGIFLHLSIFTFSLSQYLLCVSLGVYLLASKNLLNDALLVDNEGCADSAHGLLAIHRLLAPGTHDL